MAKGTCSIDGCAKPVHARGWCPAHYWLWRKHGSPLGNRPTVAERFFRRVETASSGCWLWTGGLDTDGYGQFFVAPGNRRAHRWAYEHFVGPIPEGLHLDHLCHTEACRLTSTCPHRRCVNPAHLSPATCQENLLRGNTWAAVNAAKTHCAQGHPYSGENLYVARSGDRLCRVCSRAGHLRRRAATTPKESA